MSKIQVTAISSFMHGRVHMQAGETGEFSKGDADDLAKAGLVHVGDSAQSTTTTTTNTTATEPQAGDPAADIDTDDLLGDGAKMDDAPANKMDKPAATKGGKAKG
jgi:hypothetical protein